MRHALDATLKRLGIEFHRATLRIRPVEIGDAPAWFIDLACRSAGLPARLDTLPRALRRLEHGRPLRILRNWGSSTAERGRAVFVCEPILPRGRTLADLECATDRIGWELGGLYWRILSPAESWHAPFQTLRIEFAERNPVRSAGKAPLAILRGDATGVIS